MINNEILINKIFDSFMVDHKNLNCMNKKIEHVNYNRIIDIPSNWKLLKIGEADIFFTNGNYSSKYPKTSEFVLKGIPFIQAKNIKNLTIVENGMNYITEEKHQSLMKGHLKENDVLIVIRGSIGLCALVSKKFDNSNLNSQLIVLRSNPKVIHPKFLLYQIASKFVQEQFASFTTGSAIKQLSETNLKKCYLIIPPLDEQYLIVEKIEKCLELVRKKECNDKKKEQLKFILKQKLLDDAVHGRLTNNDTNTFNAKIKKIDNNMFALPSNWNWTKLKNVCKRIYAGGDKPEFFSLYKTDELSIPVVANGILNDGIIGYTNIPKETEISITVSGRGTIGHPVIRDYPFSPAVRLLVLKPNDKIDIYYLKIILESMLLYGRGTSIKQLTIPMIKEKEIPLPSMEEQKKIVHLVKISVEMIEQL